MELALVNVDGHYFVGRGQHKASFSNLCRVFVNAELLTGDWFILISRSSFSWLHITLLRE